MPADADRIDQEGRRIVIRRVQSSYVDVYLFRGDRIRETHSGPDQWIKALESHSRGEDAVKSNRCRSGCCCSESGGGGENGRAGRGPTSRGGSRHLERRQWVAGV